MKLGRASAVAVALVLGSGCHFGTDVGDLPLVVDILDTKTEAPAKVMVTFRVSGADGAPVPNLPVSAFEILDNGLSDSGFESSKAFQPKGGNFVTSVALLLDMSGSITGSSALPALQTAAKAFVDNALDAPAVTVGVWWFDGGADIVQLHDFSADAAALKSAIDGLNPSVTRDNSTNLNGAVLLGIQLVEDRIANGVPSGATQTGALVVFTDGTDQASRVSSTAALNAVQETSVGVYSIGLRGEIDEAFLGRIGRSGSAFADNSAALLEKFTGVGDQIQALANSFYILAYCSPRRAGTANELTIRVTAGPRHGEAKTTYPAVNFTGGCVI